MRPIAVATLESKPLTKPLTAHRLKTVPKRISGLYRLSVVAKIPFQVDIGGRILEARTLEVFHERPMFMDGLEHVAAVDLLNQGNTTRMVRVHPTRDRRKPLRFRITAHEEMAERHEFERKKPLGSIETPLERKGVVKHIVETLREEGHEIETDSKTDHVADVLAEVVIGAIAISLSAGAALAASSIALAATAAPLVTPALFVATCDPSRTYVDGKLFKNLREVKVKITEGAIVGYTSP
ncbi:MAG: hypothetical protein C4520_03485 [Candidatus Abyssobacteria bacterium SURF_5]|uniref:Uncharacterized protein n=1 Tax=Abyssobacteria bacterium (strain SURF_5) TaxID=2093360 RepID=A0A3A4P1Q9_ABYX5|nr:MAG: hypothetical protein C4520_03485 [Candidatus Abyssubacteria bacterium SURF_5]